MSSALKLMRLVLGWMLMAGVLLSGRSGMVLCIGDDGHLAVEPVYHRHDGHSHDETVQTHDENALSDTGCASCDLGGCVDVPLGGDTLSQAPNSLRQDRLQKSIAGQLFSVGYETFAQTGVDRCQRPVYVTPSFLAQSLLEKWTIVLRI